jgi:hypothetical protein
MKISLCVDSLYALICVAICFFFADEGDVVWLLIRKVLKLKLKSHR